MRVLLCGATGAIGTTLGPQLVEAGHTVVGTSRHEAQFATLAARGITPLRMDGLDRDSVLAAVEQGRPDVIVHQLTGLSGGTIDPKHFDRDFAMTNRLRTEGTDHLLEAAREHGVGRVVAQSFTGWTNPRVDGPPADEQAGLDPDPAPEAVETLAAIRHVEDAVGGATDLDGLVLRYGGLYGPGTGVARGEEGIADIILKRRLPVVGRGQGLWCFVHVVDAASATVAAVERGRPGLYNVVDDEPAPVAEWLPALARALGAKPPRRIPVWLARPLIGRHGVNLMTAARGSSNAKAKAELGWQLAYPSWREGFASGL